MVVIVFWHFDNALHITLLFTLQTFTNVFMDTVVESYIIQQARRDPENGQENLQTFRILFFGIGTIFGSVITAIATQYYTPYVCFVFVMIAPAIQVVIGVLITDELETNQYATMMDDQNENDSLIEAQQD